MSRKTRTAVAEVAKLLRLSGAKASVQGKGHLRRVVQWADKYNGEIVQSYSKKDCDRMLAEMIENAAETS